MSVTTPGKNGHALSERLFQPGNTLSPGRGRPKGSRNKLGEAFIAALHDDFTKHGVEAIRRVREEAPAAYMKVIAQILPQQVQTQMEVNYQVNFPNPHTPVSELENKWANDRARLQVIEHKKG